jgi:hypothetical protein
MSGELREQHKSRCSAGVRLAAAEPPARDWVLQKAQAADEAVITALNGSPGMRFRPRS